MRKLRFFLWLGVIFFGLVALLFFLRGKFDFREQPDFISKIHFGSDFSLLDHEGQPVTQEALKGHPSLLFFGFTSCPEVCPTTLYDVSLWLEELGEAGRDVRAFFVTIDPERDTPEVMRNYVKAFSDRITGITGSSDGISQLAKSWRVYARKIPLDGGDYTMDHTASIYLVRRDGRLQGTIAYGEREPVVLQKLRLLLSS